MRNDVLQNKRTSNEQRMSQFKSSGWSVAVSNYEITPSPVFLPLL